MAVRSPQAPANAGSSMIPGYFRVDGPYGHYVVQVHNVFWALREFLRANAAWLREPGGQRALLIKIPEAIILIAKRMGPPASIPGKILYVAAKILAPLYALGGCAKPFLAFVEVGTVKYENKERIDYVAVDEKGQHLQASLPLGYWSQWANRIENIASWSLSVAECGSFLWKYQYPASLDRTFFAIFAEWTGRFISIKLLISESWFLTKTLWKVQHIESKDVTLTLAKREIVGSLLKISLALACLSIDLFQILAKNEYKPAWLDTALFWTRISPAFITPVVRHWPTLVTKPLYVSAASA